MIHSEDTGMSLGLDKVQPDSGPARRQGAQIGQPGHPKDQRKEMVKSQQHI